MRAYQPPSGILLRFVYLNALMLLLVFASAASTSSESAGHLASFLSALILAATAGVIAYECRKWKLLQIRKAVKEDLERLRVECLCAQQSLALDEALSHGAGSGRFNDDLTRRLTAVRVSPLFVQGVALVAVREIFWPYACAIWLLCLAYTFLHLPRRIAIEDALVRSAFQEMRRWFHSVKNKQTGWAGESNP